MSRRKIARGAGVSVPVNHRAIEAQARKTPGEWVYVNTYASSAGAKRVAEIITGDYHHHAITAYSPVGAFTAQTRDTELYTEAWVKYIGESEIPA